ncbi:sigma-54-dependent Fis family transcriptional regulator [Halalkalibacterium halodurans]|nr:sigma-54-dependent Fis family transcriptional regulator [Halalkalibacterium halodurans]MED4080461.1 sigma-54-dependent Fis family transcriptional regulator [Halalkalibacterium halodurans]MED4086526.1 sigma-54-dependent Fis family transcriptional regulator [Halalkalibacterium halodurans]MED4104765.1 sigma-54-dependent Fis family transcriptional regulator [Halalkalibacterium halodurans]MED4109658.1 sigma-54-dependent Fis family transcriptional regulator [Halalkalibacterium halodurans]MED41500
MMGSRENELELLNAELEDIFEASFDEIFVTDADGIVVKVNSRCEENYRLSADEMVGKHVKDLEKVGVFYPSATLEVIETYRPLELLQQTRSGRYLHVRSRPIFDRNGQLTRVVSYSRDLTELTYLKRKIEEMEGQLASYKRELGDPVTLEGIVSKSEQMTRLMELIHRVAKVDSTVLVLGETGVGKSKIVKLIHELSDRENQRFYEINCAAIPEQLIESELFGYEAGAFTGASRHGKKGLFELANGGTLFLDEIAEMPLHLQGKLLQVLQEKSFRPIGGQAMQLVDVRVIAATNQELEQMVEQGQFRRDLFYRLQVIPVHIAPLRERKEDILPLVYYFLDHYNNRYGRDVKLSPKALDALYSYLWPGNVRELENLMERLVVTSDQMVVAEDLPFHTESKPATIEGRSLKELLEETERAIIREGYASHQSSYKLAEALKISQSSAMRKIKKYIE